MITQILDEIYDGAMEMLDEINDGAMEVVEAIVRGVAILTVPLWIIPYMMIKHKKERENE